MFTSRLFRHVTCACLVLALPHTPPAAAQIVLGPYPGAFGSAVAIDGEWVAVGAPGDSKVYLFRNETGAWNLKHVVGAIVPQAGDGFGAAVAIRNGWLFVGAPMRDEAAGADAGAVYTFKLGSGFWSTNVKLTAGDPQPGAEFGSSVSATAADLVVGAPGAGGGAGAVYPFNLFLGSWTAKGKLASPQPAPVEQFGHAVAVDDGTLVIGAPGLSPAVGKAFVSQFAGGAWSAPQALPYPSVGSDYSRIGTSVAIDGDVIAVGAPGVKPEAQYTIVYRRLGGSWIYEDTVEGFYTQCNPGDSSCWLAHFQSQFGNLTLCPFGSTADADNDCDIDDRDAGIYLAQNPDYLFTSQGGAGAAVALADGKLFIGDPVQRALAPSWSFGAVHVWASTGGNWIEVNLATNDSFKGTVKYGSALAADGDTYLVGAPLVDRVLVYDAKKLGAVPIASHTLVPVPNTLIANAKTFDLKITITGPTGFMNDWLCTSVQAVTDGSFFNDPLGWHTQPNPAFFPFSATLPYDTFVTQPQGWPNTSNQGVIPGFCGAPLLEQKLVDATWLDLPPNGGAGTYVLARFTVVGGSALQVTGRSFTRQVGVEAPFDLLVKLSTCKWDLNGDGKVCQEDLGQFLSLYGSVYGQSDLGQLLAEYDGGCGDPC